MIDSVKSVIEGVVGAEQNVVESSGSSGYSGEHLVLVDEMEIDVLVSERCTWSGTGCAVWKHWSDD